MQPTLLRVKPLGLEFSSVCQLPAAQTFVESPNNPCHADATPRNPGFLSVREVAAYLGVSYNSVLGAIKNRSLPAHRFGPRGGTYRIAIEDLKAYVEASRTDHRPSRRSENRKTGAKFKKLNGERLLNAWRSQGVLPDSPEE